jgi:hypothetical protein
VRTAPAVHAGDTTAGHPPYATIYSFGGPLDFNSPEARNLWTTKDRGIIKDGRYWQPGKVTYMSDWRLADARTRPSIKIGKAAVPYLPHRGIIVAIGKAPSVERREEAKAWWRNIQEVDLLDLPGVLAVLEYDPAETGQQDHVLHILLCEDPVTEVMPRLEQARMAQQLTGRFPAHKGVYEQLALLPYQSIVPLNYDFDMG